MENDPVNKEPGLPLALRVMHVENNFPHHMDMISIGEADVCAALLATSETMEQIDPKWWPQQGRPCRLQSCRRLSCQALKEAAVLQPKHTNGT